MVLKEILLLPIFIFIAINLGSSQDVLEIQRIGQDPQLDGDLFEPAWEALEAVSLIMLNPNSGINPSERSEFKIAYSDKYLYFAAFNYDSEPDKIQATSKRRDDMQLNNDWCGLMLDTYMDQENALVFSTSPVGLRLDMQIVDDGQGDFPVNPDWNALWEVKTNITNKGWFAEFRIPLSTLRYQVKDGNVNMAIGVFRHIARKSEWDIYPNISNQWGYWSWARVSHFQKTQLSGVKAINPLYFTPYVVGGYQQNYDLADDNPEYERTDVFQRNIGMDVKFGLAKNLTLDLTVNTDFAQVEADDEEINLTRFSLFFPEKRQFFMERSNVFDFQFGGEGRLFYSRTIGLHDGNQVPLWGGGRITGRIGDWDLGVLSLQTGSFEDEGEKVLESSNHTVIRSRKQLPLNKNSYAGFMFTSLVDRKGNYDLGYGLDAILNLKGDTYLKIALARTYDSFESNGEKILDPSRYLIFLQKRTFEGFSYVLHYERVGKYYDPAMGFEFREDFTKMGHHSTWGIIPSEASKFSRISYSFHGDYFLRNEDNSLETFKVRPAFDLITKNSEEFGVTIPYEIDDVREEFELSDEITISPGKYRNMALQAKYSTSSEKTFYADFDLNAGKYYGGWRSSFGISPSLSLGTTWKFSANYQFNRINFSDLDQLYLAHLLRFKTWYMYSTKLSAYANVQYNTLNSSFFVNAKIRYNHREGNDFYIVFNDGINTNRLDVTPNLPFSEQRTILVKYTHTFRVR